MLGGRECGRDGGGTVTSALRLAGASTLLNDDPKSSVVLDREVEKEKSREPSGPRIRCPFCGWSPRKEDKWFCECGHSWNTFDTGGVCPAASTSGLKPSASRAVDGRRIRCGMFLREK